MHPHCFLTHPPPQLYPGTTILPVTSQQLPTSSVTACLSLNPIDFQSAWCPSPLLHAQCSRRDAGPSFSAASWNHASPGPDGTSPPETPREAPKTKLLRKILTERGPNNPWGLGCFFLLLFLNKNSQVILEHYQVWELLTTLKGRLSLITSPNSPCI